MKKLGRAIILALYYGFLRGLPSTSMPGGGAANRVRTWAARRLFEECGPSVVVKKGAYFGNGSSVRIGEGSQIGEDARIANDTVIGRNVMMGIGVLILSVRHRHDRTDIPIIEQGYDEAAPVTVGDDVWIGARAILLPGVTVGSHSIVGAGAVVVRDVPEGVVVAGVPARVVKTRDAEPGSERPCA